MDIDIQDMSLAERLERSMPRDKLLKKIVGDDGYYILQTQPRPQMLHMQGGGAKHANVMHATYG